MLLLFKDEYLFIKKYKIYIFKYLNKQRIKL